MTSHRDSLSVKPSQLLPPGARTALVIGAAVLFAARGALAFDSGSTGVDGPLTPSVSTRLQVPDDGVFHFTTVEIPEGVTLTFVPSTTNTPVVILASGDVTVAGVIDVSGTDAADAGATGDGNVGDDGLPGEGGPGGFGGGVGGQPESDHLGGSGLGPGGGGYGYIRVSGYRGHGGGGSFGESGGAYYSGYSGAPGATYGSHLLLPLIGGSGGGGGMGGDTFAGSGGGGGGGALLIASSGTIDVTGAIRANGGRAGDSGGGNCGAVGGGGSGGAIRLVATRIGGNGEISAAGGLLRSSLACTTSGYSIATDYRFLHSGGAGRIRLEADALQRTAATTPAYSFGTPADLFLADLPTLRILSVAGVPAPASPTGVADIQLPADTANPVAVEFEATGIPLGNIVELTVTPARGEGSTTLSNALDGSVGLSSASALVDLPQGPSTLMATVTYTLVAGLREVLERYAGEPVDALRVEASLSRGSVYVLLTRGGREVRLSHAQMASAG